MKIVLCAVVIVAGLLCAPVLRAEVSPVGTTPYIFVPKPVPLGGEPEPQIAIGENYFNIKIAVAAVVFRGGYWDRVKNVAFRAQVALDDPAFGDKPADMLVTIRKMEKNRKVYLGNQVNLVDFTPASMNTIKLKCSYEVDRTNALAGLLRLGDGGALRTPIGLDVGAVAMARGISTIAQGILGVLRPSSESQVNTMQFEVSLNIPTKELRPGYFVFLGTADSSPGYGLPQPLPSPDKFSVVNSDLLMDGEPVTKLSYLVLEVTTIPRRDWRTGRGFWRARIDEADSLSLAVQMQSLVGLSDEDRQGAWTKCVNLLKEAHILLQPDPVFSAMEKTELIRTAWARTRSRIYPAAPAAAPIDAESAKVLGTTAPEELASSVVGYSEKMADSRVIQKYAGTQLTEFKSLDFTAFYLQPAPEGATGPPKLDLACVMDEMSPDKQRELEKLRESRFLLGPVE